MKKISAAFVLGLISLCSFAQKAPEKSLLWKVSGNGISKPSYLFGTIHMLCKDDAALSDSMKLIIREAEEVYFEVDLDNMMEMMGMLKEMKMKGDTTLRDLLSAADYTLVKEYFVKHSAMLPFSQLETYKPILAAAVIQQGSLKCGSTAMEQEIMTEAKQYRKKISGLETMGYQASVLDQIPYKAQAEQLLGFIKEETRAKSDTEATATDTEFREMMDAYREQDLDKLESLIKKSDIGMDSYADVLLYKRNYNWIEKLKQLLPAKRLLVAVGAGHLPGDKGVINLLRKAGFTVTPVVNTSTKTI
ncbi:MAG: TraB/GumN family protein [Chitinophagaceae bacterium]|nr:MAG: TraB/GumN family protein [Chitinophagaceae bacterium]